MIRVTRAVALGALLLLATTPAAAQNSATARTEILRTDVPDEFEVGFDAQNQDQAIIELVRPPETVNSWTTLITLQLFYDRTQDGAMNTFHDWWSQSMQRACPGSSYRSVNGTVDGMPAIRVAFTCSLNPQTGKPENLEGVIVQGQANLMMVQVAFRQSIEAGDTALVERVAGGLKVCDQRSLDACSARKATGFIPGG